MTADLNPSAYDAFAPFYDAFTAASDYDTIGAEVLRVGTGFGLTGNTLLDLACGTGNSFEPFLRRGYRVTGCDASPGMLAEAAIKWPEARLARCDLRELVLDLLAGSGLECLAVHGVLGDASLDDTAEGARDQSRAAQRLARSAPRTPRAREHGTWSRVRAKQPHASFRPAVPSASERMFERTTTR